MGEPEQLANRGLHASLSTGERILLNRRRRGFSIEELAARVGTSPASLSRYERDLWPPPGDVLRELALALEVTSDYLLGIGQGNPDTPGWLDRFIGPRTSDLRAPLPAA